MENETQQDAPVDQINDAPVTVPVDAPVVVDVPAAVAAPAKVARRGTLRVQRQVVAVDPVTADATTETVVQDEEESALPESVTLASPYAYYDDEGALHSWLGGQVVTGAEEIALLVGRGAIVEAV